MATEVRGTFSVADPMAAGAFLRELMRLDRLTAESARPQRSIGRADEAVVGEGGY